MNPAAAAVAFFALGVTAFGSALLLLFNPRSRGVWWFVAFQGTIATWLAAQPVPADSKPAARKRA